MRLGRRGFGVLVAALGACGVEPAAPAPRPEPLPDLARLVGPFGLAPSETQRRSLDAFARTWRPDAGVDLARLRDRVARDRREGAVRLDRLSERERALVHRLVLDLWRHAPTWAARAGPAISNCG